MCQQGFLCLFSMPIILWFGTTQTVTDWKWWSMLRPKMDKILCEYLMYSMAIECRHLVWFDYSAQLTMRSVRICSIALTEEDRQMHERGHFRARPKLISTRAHMDCSHWLAAAIGSSDSTKLSHTRNYANSGLKCVYSVDIISGHLFQILGQAKPKMPSQVSWKPFYSITFEPLVWK